MLMRLIRLINRSFSSVDSKLSLKSAMNVRTAEEARELLKVYINICIVVDRTY